MIKIVNVDLQLGNKSLLEQASLTIHPRQHWGIIGANGAGKSSLFKLLLGDVHEDAGSVHVPKDWLISHMAQEVAALERSALDYVLDGDEEFRAIEDQITAAGDDGNALAELFSRMEQIDGYSANARAQKLLVGLGFQNNEHTKNASEFSGGWRIRLNLAKALMCRSDLLLLDEPTNHLDIDATLWLEQWLKDYTGTLIIISHDRDFLDNVISHTANIENKKLVSYTGNYSAYETQKAERLSQQQAAFEKQQTRIAEIENFVRRFRAKATKAKQAQSRLKELERMEKIAAAHIDSPFEFYFPEPEKMPQTLLNLTEANIGYNGTALLSKINLSILSSTRIGLLGHNGAGKSTLLKTLLDQSTLINGDRVEAQHLNIGYFAQHQIESLDFNASCYLHIHRLSPDESEQTIRNFLGSFGFQGDRVFEPIEKFSGGEKARLALAILAWQKPNLLLLDEPTNHLDLEVRHALTLALQQYNGAIVVISHDRHLLKNTVEEFLLVDSGKAEIFDGSIEDYQQWLKTKTKDAPSESQTTKPAHIDKKLTRQNAAQQREKLKPLRNALKTLEKQMASLQVDIDELEQKISAPEIYESTDDLTPLLKKQSELKKTLANVEEQWMEKSLELESGE